MSKHENYKKFCYQKEFPRTINCGSMKFCIKKNKTTYVPVPRTYPTGRFPCQIVFRKYLLSYRMIKCNYIGETFSLRKKFFFWQYLYVTIRNKRISRGVRGIISKTRIFRNYGWQQDQKVYWRLYYNYVGSSSNLTLDRTVVSCNWTRWVKSGPCDQECVMCQFALSC